MLAAHKKLEQGEKVDHNVLSQLLLGGVINILAQHDTIVRNEEKVKHLEHAQVTNQSRIEALENWVLRQNDQILELEQNVARLDRDGVIEKENVEIVTMKKRIVSLEIDVSNVKTKPETLPTPNLSTQRTCQKCNSNFPRTCDLENHMIAEHNVEKKHKCSDCGKHFLFKWILRKHVKTHNETEILQAIL